MLAVDVATVRLAPVPLAPGQIVSGSPEVGIAVLQADERCERGIWEITPGVVTDVEADEMFVVLTGQATVELLDSGQVLELAPGVLGIFTAGTPTRWTVRATLRKAYQVNLGPR